ncbi:hypothetical protein JH06_5912, partial [Blastocystis sp. subtype 4]|uniref:hypothetical protein n=1 Tax=Blastocystis sp. subtype 4 TaxID=944170 RepID=UPI00071162F1
MSDLDHDGDLDFAEFVIITHILFTCRNGVPLPQQLPPSLIPPSKANLVQSIPSVPVPVPESAPVPESEEDESDSDSDEEEVKSVPQSIPPMMPPKPTMQGQGPRPMMPPKPIQGTGNDPFVTTPQQRMFYQNLFI